MKKTKLTGDRIATLGSKMMKCKPNASKRSLLWVKHGGEFVTLDYLTVGDIRDAGASLVSQADGPEVKRKKGKR